MSGELEQKPVLRNSVLLRLIGMKKDIVGRIPVIGGLAAMGVVRPEGNYERDQN